MLHKLGIPLRLRLSIPLAAVVAATAALITVEAVDAGQEVGALATFSTPGTNTWTVPGNVKQVTFEVFGASGGAGGGAQALTGQPPTTAGGLGGEATATFNVLPGQVFKIVVGGKGGTYCTSLVDGACSRAAGGFNGGGGGWSGGGGGGRTDVWAGICALDTSCNLNNDPGAPILVAGGGGGGGGDAGCDGGDGGGLVGATGECGGGVGGKGGTQSTPASGGGGTAVSGGGGGGGGGWNGGERGRLLEAGQGGGGGGSAFVVPWAVGALTLNAGVHSGDGKVVVSKAKEG